MIKRVVIKSIKAAGVIVLMNDDEAWLPARELSTQFNPAIELDKQGLCAVNDELEVVVYGKEFGSSRKLVSHIRVHNDPWEKVKQWKTGIVKDMVINSVTRTRAFGSIEPGIEGYIELSEINNSKYIRFPSSWSHFKFIAAGDIIAGYVDTSHIDHEKRLLKLDAASYIKKIEDISELFPVQSVKGGKVAVSRKNNVENSQPIVTPLTTDIRKMLVVDNSKEFVTEVSDYLKYCGIEVLKAMSKDEAETIINNLDGPSIDVALIDIHLTSKMTDFSGLDIVRSIEKLHNDCRTILTTGDEMVIDKISKNGEKFLISHFLFKPFGLEELSQAISEASRKQPKELHEFFVQNVKKGREDVPPSFDIVRDVRSVYSALGALKESIRAEYVILFGIHPVSRNVGVVELSGDVNEALHDYLDKLRYSPISDVAIGGEHIFEGNFTNTLQYSKHKFLHAALQYESCIAYPVKVHGERKYALFAFHSRIAWFTKESTQRVLTSANEIAHILAVKRLRETLRNEMPFILAGKTYGSMAHDLLEALMKEFRILNLQNLIKDKKHLEIGDIQKIEEGLNTLLRELRRSRGIVKTIRRMSRSHHESEEEVDVFEAVSTAAGYMESEAETFNTSVHVVPPKRGIPRKIKIRRASFEQVIYNLILNAAQQIDRFKFARGEGHVQIEIDDSSVKDGWVRILIHDTGPGIHTYCIEEIFQKGYTTRESGSGMGLDICKSIINQAKGKIGVLKSVLFIGTTFEVLLPIKKNVLIHKEQTNG